jgi:hypothetical protein
MSRNGWERGTLKLPSAAWAPFKKGLQEGMSKHKEADYALALKLHAALVEQKKGKRGFDLKAAFDAEFAAEEASRLGSSWGWSSGPRTQKKYPFVTVNYYEVKKSILGKEETPGLYKPQKKDFPKCTSATLSFSGDSCSVTLDNAKREVTWATDDGNHSVEHAHESALGKLVFELLRQVKWTRNTGGTISGNDEYNRENTDEGGGGNYVAHRFGPLGEFKFPAGFKFPRKRVVRPASNSR